MFLSASSEFYPIFGKQMYIEERVLAGYFIHTWNNIQWPFRGGRCTGRYEFEKQVQEVQSASGRGLPLPFTGSPNVDQRVLMFLPVLFG